ncbi:MAG: hypothetical protein ISS26_05425 [Candidatus Omnitrophica bacterium]|nr:hypothetical protein [Candidatus Omnitrophota bacterium]
MKSELMALYITAASIGFFHTLLGPDHYLPFIVIGKARKWSLAKLSIVTFLCGLGHHPYYARHSNSDIAGV